MRFITTLITILVVSPAFCESPEKIHPKTKVIKPVEWYTRQASLWKEKTIEDMNDREAWLNYFLAAKYSTSDKQALFAIADASSKFISGTFEGYLIEALSRPFTEEGIASLMKAHALDPSNPLAFSELILTNEYRQDVQGRRKYGDLLFRKGLVSQSLLNYSYNVLMSVEKDAVLFTDSENTTVPIHLLQDVLGVRPDVILLNLDILEREQYRQVKLSAAGLKFEFDGRPTRVEICEALPRENPSRSFYYALTLSRENILPIKDQLYVVGLASQLSRNRLDNLATIRNNIENRFLLDYLTVDFNGESEYSAGMVLNTNYLVPMLLLLEHYRQTKDVEKAADLEKTVMDIARSTGKTLLVQNFLSGKSSIDAPFIPHKIEHKAWEGQFKYVKGNVYAHEYEVTNQQYLEFLQFLEKNGMTEKYERCKFHIDQYDEPARSFMAGYHANRQPMKKEKYFLTYPVINVSYEAALEYAQWLTDQYNNTLERKYKRVKFRLPSVDEWQIAAASLKDAASWKLVENSTEVKLFGPGKDATKKYEKKTVSLGDPEILYPWFRYWKMRNSPVNSKGCPLGNFKFPDSQKHCVQGNTNSADGFLLMSPVQSYFPNDIGLYDVVGNVAEMTSEKGKACGGSWNHPPDQCTIKSINEYTNPSSDIGFRLFMEVIEP